MKIQALIAALALAPAALYAAQPLNAAAANGSTGNTTPIRISTGVVPPQLVYKTDVVSSMDWEWAEAGRERTAEVSMIVDKTGKPTNLKIVKSAGTDLDQNLLEAVSKYRFQPATVSQEPTAMEVDLQVHVLKPASGLYY